MANKPEIHINRKDLNKKARGKNQLTQAMTNYLNF